MTIINEENSNCNTNIDYSLLIKYLAGELNPQEQIAVDAWLAESESHRDYLSKMEATIMNEDYMSLLDFSDKSLGNKQYLNKFIKEFDEFAAKDITKKTFKYKRLVIELSCAAAVLLLGLYLGLSGIFSNEKNKIAVKEPVAKVSTIVPGKDKAVIITKDSVIDLEASPRVLMDVKGATIAATDGKVTYIPDNSDTNIANQQTDETLAESSLAQSNTSNTKEYNTIAVPRGGQYTITLSDGSTIMLNSSSELHYPVVFDGNERRVFLVGEAFFTVAPNSEKPFIVETDMGAIKVYGTRFNVKRYKDEKNIKVTLEKGSISFSCDAHDFSKEVFVEPGYQICYNGDGKLPVPYPVKLKNEVGWVGSELNFDNMSLLEVMKILSRWYNCDIFINDAQLRKMSFSGSLDKFDSIEQFLDLFVASYKFRYFINGNNVYISKENSKEN